MSAAQHAQAQQTRLCLTQQTRTCSTERREEAATWGSEGGECVGEPPSLLVQAALQDGPAASSSTEPGLQQGSALF